MPDSRTITFRIDPKLKLALRGVAWRKGETLTQALIRLIQQEIDQEL